MQNSIAVTCATRVGHQRVLRYARAQALVWSLLSAAGFGGCGDDIKPPAEAQINVIMPDGQAFCDDGGCPDAGPPSPATCGDGVVYVGLESCDDGNVLPGDGCNATCQSELCGNGRIDQAEECDPPSADSCTPLCLRTITSCGNGATDGTAGEECDDGNDKRGDGCHECRRECGDGVLAREFGEECEPRYSPKDSNGVSLTCTDQCKRKAFCGDGRVDPSNGEQCDPVNGLSCIDDCKLARPGGMVSCRPPAPDAGVDGGHAAEQKENLVPNGSFASNFDGWNPGSGAVTVKHVPEAGGSVEVGFTGTANTAFSVDGVVRCVAVTAGAFYEVQGQYLNFPGQPVGTRAFGVVLLYPNGTCSGTAVPSGSGSPAPAAQVGQWLTYRHIVDATRAGPAGSAVSISIKLGVVTSAGAAGKARWRQIEMREIDAAAIDPKCGNCLLEPGEGCDDGNNVRADGCDPRCQVENDCGNGRVDVGEQCDGGRVKFTDGSACTPMCMEKTACDACALGQCRRQVDACLGLQGTMAAGKAKGQPQSVVCERLRRCVQRSGCDGATAISSRQTLAGMPGAFMENCYCGTSGASCLQGGAANGSCREEVEAALETSDPTAVLQRVGGANAQYPIFAALRELRLCEGMSCRAQCSISLTCGDGVVQERSAEFATTAKLTVGGKQVECKDGLTPSGKGCSFEECDGSLMCDDKCLLLQCGNGILQTAEACDDGNRTSGDGCDKDCKAEFACGDNKVDSAFGEQCDRPSTGRVCSKAEYESNPASCGCGSTCIHKVCGNEVVQEGEECDPPNGSTCGADCKRVGLSECVGCMQLVDDVCGKQLLNGIKDEPGLETGCLNDKACFDLLQCQVNTRCGLVLAPSECYCGLAAADLESCDQPGFEPKGPCKAEMVAAYTSQWSAAPASPAELLSRYNAPETAAGRPASMFISNLLVDCNLYQTGGLATALRASGADEATVNRCVKACGSN